MKKVLPLRTISLQRTILKIFDNEDKTVSESFNFNLTFISGGELKTASSRDPESYAGIMSFETADDGFRHKVTVRPENDVCLVSYYEYDNGFAKGIGDMKALKDSFFFMNGYQSWTDTKEFRTCEKERDVMKLPRKLVDMFSFDKYGDAFFYKYGKDYLHGYDTFYAKGPRELFIQNLNYKNAYLIFELNRKTGALTVKSDVEGAEIAAGDVFTLCEYFYTSDLKKGFEAFSELFPKRGVKKIFGYTSWYNYYQNIDEKTLLRDLDALDSRFNLFQLDDGYQTKIGDWLSVDPAKLPGGLEQIVKKIHDKGYMAGLWMAPLVAEKESRLFADHPDWFKKDKNGDPVRCGANWTGFYALDLENEEVREYIKKCLRHYADMGFDFFKLDFLYAASVPSYKGKTRSQAAEFAYDFLREVLGDRLILGCGATLYNAACKFDYMRIGPDVSLEFDDVFYMRIMHRERISTKVTLKNTVFRSFMNDRLFGNDPDVFLLRDENIKLSPENRKALSLINALFGNVMMTSDDIGLYDEEKKQRLDEVLTLFNNANVDSYRYDGRFIDVDYSVGGKSTVLRYDTEKGVLI